MNNIKSLRIIGLKKFKDIKIEFNEHVNIIVGENEAGKSTILEAIDIVINQLYKNSDKSIIGELINKENIDEFKKNPNIERLPKIYIELELNLPTTNIKNLEYSGLEYLDSEQDVKSGITFKCEIDKDSEDEILGFINSGKIPYEYYRMQWKTFGGAQYTAIRKPIKYLSINTSNIESNNSFNYYNKSLFHNKYDENRRLSIKANYISQIEGLLSNISEMEDIDEKRKFGINTKKVVLENIITILDEGISIENKGKGMENLIKTKMALKKSSNNNIISIEEPENHLSHSNLRKMIKTIEENEENGQIIITTHNSLIISSLDLRNVIFLNEAKPAVLKDVDEKISKFFLKSDNNKLMEFILSKKIILVEGNTEYMLVPDFYERIFVESMDKSDIYIISVAGLGYKNYIEIAKILDKKVAVITDNDKNQEKIDEISDFNQKNENIKIFTDANINRWTIEVCLYEDNRKKMEQIIDVNSKCNYLFNGEDYGKVLGKMLNNKADTAYQLLNEDDIVVPNYIKEEMEWIRG